MADPPPLLGWGWGQPSLLVVGPRESSMQYFGGPLSNFHRQGRHGWTSLVEGVARAWAMSVWVGWRGDQQPERKSMTISQRSSLPTIAEHLLVWEHNC
eukprot:3537028-Amphidinium_carterae.1